MIFIDTSAFYAMDVKNDANYERASRIKEDIARNKYGMPYTTNYVIDETITLMRFRAGHEEAVAFGEKIKSSRVLKIIRADENIENRALNIFKEFRDIELSFTDCVTYVVMKELGIKDIFAFDRHFSQLGFRVVP